MRSSKPVTVTLGEMQDRVEARIRSGTYASVSEVVRAGLRALEREEAAIETVLHRKVQEALDDPSQPLPADQVFAELRAHHAGRRKADKDDV
ncbi:MULTISPECIES: type II toxin-antitoxin system ParD family antitoxin [Methylorubrum]|uniref:type II toxin-antitoxin system ParD family antitoxin n=1 Tax=Methylorubrum TaxID=2282523 RepID=UPI00209E9FFC|nr:MULTISPECIES: type II toxin-antitoxin system ParD family antitoxin [Methylorubrum]MCP1550585.1 antitoxin ParD1/3/4 [Methylorubrum zatmanii]MCP1552802.1 antitoxin ParD1/3/4 [Methylorubrum extorquens]MCP1580888.1 antitoxin ParD1/3/4 [Methylorubrum extorquens]